MTGSDTGGAMFTPPGPGGWKRLADHFPGSLTPEYQRIYAETCPPGMAAYMARYGVLARTLDIAFVHGHLYITPVPVAGPREMTRTPPAAAVWLLARLHPAFRRRTKAARRTLRERPWRAVTSRWFAAERYRWRERNQAVQDIDPSELADEELATHLGVCRALVVDGYRRHFELHGDDLLPVGLLLARCREWGIEPKVAAAALRGVPNLITGEATPDWMLITGYDLDSLAWTELTRRPTPHAETSSDAGYGLHPFVPREHHAELDELLDDARNAVQLRDDNGMFTAAWPMGLLRRAMLAAGTRLEFADPTLAVELTVDELIAALRSDRAVPAIEADQRREDRARRSALPAPATLGPDFAIPPLRALPRPLALIGAAQIAASDNMLGSDQPVGVGSHPYEGRALVVDDPSTALDLIEPGDVLITRPTSPAWNLVLSQAGSLVTSHGGLVSHAAVIARDLGIPAVIGDRTVLDRVQTGDHVRVDPEHARVQGGIDIPFRNA